MAVSTAVFNQDVQNPIAYAQGLVETQRKEDLAKGAAAAKKAEANAKEFSELMKVGDDWTVKFREPLTQRLSGFRDQIRQYAAGGGDPTNHQFQQWYNENRTKLISDAKRGKYVEDYMKTAREAVKNDPYRSLRIWEKEFYKQFQDENGDWVDPSQIDIEAMETAQNNMAGYRVDKAAKDFVEASPEELTQKIFQRDLGNNVTGRGIEDIKSKLYVIDPTTGAIKRDPTTNMPMINMTDEWVAQWNGDTDRSTWLQQTAQQIMEANDLDYKYGSPEYVELQKAILDPVLRPYAQYDKTMKSFSTTKNKTDELTPSQRRAREIELSNANLFYEKVDQIRAGDFSALEANPKIEFIKQDYDTGEVEVTFKDGIIKTFDPLDEQDEDFLYQYISFEGKKPTAKVLEEVRNERLNKGIGVIPAEQRERNRQTKLEQQDNATRLKGMVENSYASTRELNQDQSNGGLIGMSYTNEDGERITVTKVEGRNMVQSGTQKIEFDDGSTIIINGNEPATLDIIDKLAKGSKVAFKKEEPKPEKPGYTQAQQDSITLLGLKEIIWE